ncbi:MAG: hypothetical protein FWD99_08430 [Oscillospiraceae bacterium]|nr:hypothetical protein [Oscillospiraceae bacterium]
MGELEEKISGILNNPQEMEKIMALAQSLMGGSADPGPTQGEAQAPTSGSGLNLEGLLGGLDPDLMKKLAGVLAGGIGSAALLQAMTPHLKEERKNQLKQAITIAQMVRVAKAVFSEESKGR